MDILEFSFDLRILNRESFKFFGSSSKNLKLRWYIIPKIPTIPETFHSVIFGKENHLCYKNLEEIEVVKKCSGFSEEQCKMGIFCVWSGAKIAGGGKCSRFQEILDFGKNLEKLCSDDLYAHIVAAVIFGILAVIIIPGMDKKLILF